MEHLERDTPMMRKQSGGWTGEDETISYPKSRGRSQSIKVLEDATATPTPAKRLVPENSPTKKTPGKKGTRSASTPQKPKSRSGTTRDTSSAQRPPTRSGELGQSNSVSKRPEGDPPWINSMYKPDPRLPPDQQLLPTVAKRLQQEQWEKEGKFGNVYDTSFRPLSDEGFHSPPEPLAPEEERKPEEPPSEWPLRAPKSPALSSGRPGTSGGYSTMPKITGSPQGIGPLPSPKPLTRPPVRIQEPPENEKQEGGCCCVIM
jgi:hypothetical protein